MARSLDAPTTTAVESVTTTPLFLLEMDFDPEIRFSSRETYSWATFSWLAADIDLDFRDSIPTISVFNEDTTFGQTVLSKGTAGRSVKIYQAYEKATPGTYTDPIMIFSGELGAAIIKDFVVLACKRNPPSKTPRHHVIPPTFNHTPKAGTRFETATGIVILEG